MKVNIEDGRVQLFYDAIKRRYYTTVIDITNEVVATQTLYFCPFCGTRLPKDLHEEYCTILNNMFNVRGIGDIPKAKIPSEFKSDEWWIKRGL